MREEANAKLGNFSGEANYPHLDLKDGITVMYYANLDADWDPIKCQGETVFYASDDEAFAAVAPRQARVVIFDGNIPHRAGSPARDCYAQRITLAVKFRSRLE